MLKSFTIACAATITLFSPVAIAEASTAESNGWRVVEANEDETPRVIVTGDIASIGVMFSCENDRLQAGIGTETGLMETALESQKRRYRSSKADLTISDAAPHTSRWLVFPTRNMALSTDQVAAKKIFNAAVRGDAITLDAPREDTVTAQLPEMDDVFTTFAKGCVVTK